MARRHQKKQTKYGRHLNAEENKRKRKMVKEKKLLQIKHKKRNKPPSNQQTKLLLPMNELITTELYLPTELLPPLQLDQMPNFDFNQHTYTQQLIEFHKKQQERQCAKKELLQTLY
eukprot:207807_1